MLLKNNKILSHYLLKKSVRVPSTLKNESGLSISYIQVHLLILNTVN